MALPRPENVKETVKSTVDMDYAVGEDFDLISNRDSTMVLDCKNGSMYLSVAKVHV